MDALGDRLEPPLKGADLAVIVPTKDRPEKIRNLLESLATQTVRPGRVIVVASGEDIRALAEGFSSFFQLDYLYSEVPGQIRQRKMGVERLDNSTSFVATLDDDILLEPEAIEKNLKFWNQAPADTAGVGFNIVNEPAFRSSWVHRLLQVGAPEPGRVLKSGFSSPIVGLRKSVPTQWLNGGTTVWRQDILQRIVHQRDAQVRWAVCEDLIMSYPVSLEHPLYVCADARVIHDDPIASGRVVAADHQYRGRVHAIWTIEFVTQNADLSIYRSCYALLVSSLAGALSASRKGGRNHWRYYLGRLIGLAQGLVGHLIWKQARRWAS